MPRTGDTAVNDPVSAQRSVLVRTSVGDRGECRAILENRRPRLVFNPDDHRTLIGDVADFAGIDPITFRACGLVRFIRPVHGTTTKRGPRHSHKADRTIRLPGAQRDTGGDGGIGRID